jgi:predicted transcriptional regulator
MAFKPKDKEKVLESLMIAHRQGQITEINLRFQGKTDEAEKVWQENRRLSAEIDILIGQMMDEWLDNAERAKKGLAEANTKLEATVAEIKKQINVAQNVVKLIELLDDAVVIAKKVVAGL